MVGEPRITRIRTDRKRSLGGPYVAVAPKHLPRYCQEQAFRFNTSKVGDASRFRSVMRNMVGRKLTYA
jgi:hypothetical protein